MQLPAPEHHHPAPQVLTDVVLPDRDRQHDHKQQAGRDRRALEVLDLAFGAAQLFGSLGQYPRIVQAGVIGKQARVRRYWQKCQVFRLAR